MSREEPESAVRPYWRSLCDFLRSDERNVETFVGVRGGEDAVCLTLLRLLRDSNGDAKRLGFADLR